LENHQEKSMRYFPKLQQRMQVQVYGYLLSQNGHEVKNVALVAIPRDGIMAEIRAHVKPYDEALALGRFELGSTMSGRWLL
jgi:hypothetical protein